MKKKCHPKHTFVRETICICISMPGYLHTVMWLYLSLFFIY